MKRGKPLKRSGSLKRRTPLRQGESKLKRTELRSRPKASRGALERAAAEAWHRSVLGRCERVKGKLRCPACGKLVPERLMDAHHVVSKERIKAYVAGLLLPRDEADGLLRSLLWDKRNGLPLCKDRCHPRHTMAKERVSKELLDARHWQFAREMELDYVLDREYA